MPVEIGTCLPDGFWSGQDVLTILRSHLTTKVIDFCAYHCPGCKWEEESLLPRLLQLPYRNRELRPITGRLGFGEHLKKSWGLLVESHLQWYEMIDPTPICTRGPSRRCLGSTCDGGSQRVPVWSQLWVDTSQARGAHLEKMGSRSLARCPSWAWPACKYLLLFVITVRASKKLKPTFRKS